MVDTLPTSQWRSPALTPHQCTHSLCRPAVYEVRYSEKNACVPSERHEASTEATTPVTFRSDC